MPHTLCPRLRRTGYSHPTGKVDDVRVRIPTTMPTLVAVGYLVAVLPLLISMLFAELALQHLTQGTRAVVEEGLTSAQISLRLRSQTIDLERGIRQYLVLKSPALLPVVDSRWSQVDASITRLGQLHRNKGLQAESLELWRDFNQAHTVWKTGEADDATSVEESVKRVQALESAIDAVIESSRQQVVAQAHRLHVATERARIQLILSALGLLLLGALLAWGFIRVVSRPINQLTRAITVLRRGGYQEPVSIPFPSEFRRVGQQLEWLRRRLFRLEADKDRFLRQVSHEFKTPLASLLEGTELLRGGALGELLPPQTEVVGIMDESSRELESLINNLLAYAEWRAERQSAQDRWFDTRQLLDEVLTAHRLSFAKRELNSEVQVRVRLLCGRRNQLRVALDNLITNALKHAPTGSAIEIEVGDDGGKFVLAVRDLGKGVPDAEKDAIFGPFFRGTEAEEQVARGTGVGLAIVQETMRAHGGSVSVEDACPGSRFRLVWPYPAD